MMGFFRSWNKPKVEPKVIDATPNSDILATAIPNGGQSMTSNLLPYNGMIYTNQQQDAINQYHQAVNMTNGSWTTVPVYRGINSVAVHNIPWTPEIITAPLPPSREEFSEEEIAQAEKIIEELSHA